MKPLQNGIPIIVDSSINSRSEYVTKFYSIDVDHFSSDNLNIMTTGGEGDVDIMVNYNNYPRLGDFIAKSAHGFNNEQIVIKNPDAGKYAFCLCPLFV